MAHDARGTSAQTGGSGSGSHLQKSSVPSPSGERRRLPSWIARRERRMRATARRRNRAILLSEAHVRGSGQSPDCSHENFALGWPRNDEARPAHTSVAAENAKWNSYSTTKLVVVKSCGVTNRKADESGTVPPSEPAQAIPGRAFVHRPLASARETAKTWLCRSSSAWPGPPRSPDRARETFRDSLASDDPRSEHVAHCNGHCRRFFCSLCRRARCPGRDARKEGST